MSSDSFTIPKGFAKVVLVVAGMNFQMFLLGFKVGGIRKKIFNQEFMKKHFEQTHQRQLGQSIKSGGYPDMGNGIYSQKLSYADWYRFNIAQRNHQNYVENISWATTTVVAAGLVCPQLGVGLGLTHIVGRFLYSFFYGRQGGAKNKGRIIGMALTQIANLVGIGFFIKKFFFDK